MTDQGQRASEHPRPEGTYVSTLGAIGQAYRIADVRTTLSSFRSYVSRGEAPAPAFKVGRQPFWDRQDIWTWAKKFAQKSPTRNAEAEPPGALALGQWTHRALGSLPAPGEASDVERAYLALTHLPRYIAQCGQAEAHHGRMAREQEEASLRVATPARTLADHWDGWRLRRQTAASSDAADTYRRWQQETRQAMAAAQRELGATQEWLTRVQAWTAEQTVIRRRRETDTAFEGWLEAAAAQHRVSSAELIPTHVYAANDRHRIAYLMDAASGPNAEDLTFEALSKARRGSIALAGADFGYEWRVLTEHDPAFLNRSVSEAAAGWRLSWNQCTTEMYLERRKERVQPMVYPLTSLPTSATFEAVVAWMEPFETLSRFPGAFGVLKQEIAIQEASGWVSLDRDRP